MGLFKPRKEKTQERKVRPAPEQTEWARFILPRAQTALGIYEPWMYGRPTEAERYWLGEATRLWEELPIRLTETRSAAEELLERAREIKPEDLTAEYLESLQKAFSRAVEDTIKRVSSTYAARGAMYGRPLAEATDRELTRVAETFAREYARAAMTAPELQLRAEEIRRAYLLPYLRAIERAALVPYEILPRYVTIALTPEERRRQFFLNLLRGIYTLAPYQTAVGYELMPSTFETLFSILVPAGAQVASSAILTGQFGGGGETAAIG